MDNPRADRVRTVRSLGGRSAQSRTGLLLVEGPGAVLELVTWRPECVTDVYVTERVEESQPEIVEQARQATRWVHRVTDEVAHAMSPDCQGIIAVARHDAIVTQMPSVDGLAVILARIQDPGNVGTLIRTADAMGAQCVLTTVGTADVRSPKVIRSTAGSVSSALAPGVHSSLGRPEATDLSAFSTLTRATRRSFPAHTHGFSAMKREACHPMKCVSATIWCASRWQGKLNL